MNTRSNRLPLRPLGASGLQVTPICVGGAPLGDMPETFAYSAPEEQALATVRAAFTSPINFLDTAAAKEYGIIDKVIEQRELPKEKGKKSD